MANKLLYSSTTVTSTHIYMSDYSSHIPTHRGYVFSKWGFSTEETTEEVTDFIITGDTDVYVIWTAQTFTLKYDTNGGTPTCTQRNNVQYGTKFLIPEEQETTEIVGAQGQYFKGWYSESTGGYQYISGVTTLTAATTAITTIAAYAQYYQNFQCDKQSCVIDSNISDINLNGIISFYVSDTVEGNTFSIPISREDITSGTGRTQYGQFIRTDASGEYVGYNNIDKIVVDFSGASSFISYSEELGFTPSLNVSAYWRILDGTEKTIVSTKTISFTKDSKNEKLYPGKTEISWGGESHFYGTKTLLRITIYPRFNA